MTDDLPGRAERLLGGLPLAVLAFDRGGLVFANPAAQQLLGVTAPAAGDAHAILGDGALAEAVSRAADRAAPIEVEASVDGRALAARACRDDDGEVELIVHDVTDARRLERIRRDFVVNASHELKTPAAGMRALAESIAVAVDRDPDRARRMIERLHGEAERLSGLVRDLLDLARMEEASAQAVPARVDVAAVVHGQMDRYRATAAERGVSLSCDCLEAVVVAVPEDIRLIVDNLVENAVRYNRDGGGVHITMAREDGHVVLTVADTGIGIDASQHERIFERFYRVDRARSRAAGGTGLGLSLVRNAVARHGGSVSVDSRPGRGSTFRVSLPLDGGERQPKRPVM
ncbi:MAG TPA: ATP-binding protein [Egibacteraceae bacterium]|nr:ATP-binding protein [Egibacteraceae bacterium]